MIKTFLILYWFLCHSTLSAARTNQIKEEISVSQQRCLTYTQQAVGRSCTKTPYMALLGFGDEPSKTKWSGPVGIIISDRYILTSVYIARHPDDVARVALGVKDSKVPDADWRVHEITQITQHPEYENDVYNNDLVLLRTATPMQFGASAQPACLPPCGEGVGRGALLATFGQTYSGHGPVRTVTLQQYADEQCAGSFTNTTQLCLGHREDLEQSCWSYIGDPAVQRSRDSACVATVVGVESYGSDCSHPTVYARVAAYVPWVESVVWPEGPRVHI